MWFVSLLGHFIFLSLYRCGPGYLSRYSDWLRAGRSGNRIPVGARFSAPVRTCAGAHPSSYTMGTGSFPRVKRPGRGVDHRPPSSAEVKERLDLFLYPFPPSGPSWPVLGCTLPLVYILDCWNTLKAVCFGYWVSEHILNFNINS
jgi:hypothetical protein